MLLLREAEAILVQDELRVGKFNGVQAVRGVAGRGLSAVAKG
jgi:hypothetical protein